MLAHIYAHSAATLTEFSYVEVGPGCDCAIVRTVERSLLKTDSVVEGVHFIPATPIDLIARKAVARALSDIAAMAGTPRACLAACVLPFGYPHAHELFDRVRFWATHYNCPVVGGDIASHPRQLSQHNNHTAPLILTISVLGDAHPTVLAPRWGARVDDNVYVSGALGGSLGSDMLGRHLRPTPRLELARWLADTFNVTLHSMMDISDGLGRDCARLAHASNVSVELHEALIPIHPDVSVLTPLVSAPLPTALNPRTLHALSDGEDYELLFTVAPDTPIPPAFGNIPLTHIGNVTKPGPYGSMLRTIAGETIDASALGFEHGS